MKRLLPIVLLGLLACGDGGPIDPPPPPSDGDLMTGLVIASAWDTCVGGGDCVGDGGKWGFISYNRGHVVEAAGSGWPAGMDNVFSHKCCGAQGSILMRYPNQLSAPAVGEYMTWRFFQRQTGAESMAYTMYLNGPQYEWFAQARGVVWEVQVSLRHEADGWHFDTLMCPLDGSGQRMAAQCRTQVPGVTDSVHQFSGQATMQSFEGFWLGLDESETPHATHPACGDISCFTGFRDAPWAQHSFSSFSGDVLSWGGFSIRRGRIADRVWPVPTWTPQEVGG